MVKISLIFAHDDKFGMGLENNLPHWNCKEDLKRFKQLTLNHPILMGRKTWDSLPKKPLPKRLNFVLSKKLINQENGMILLRSIEELDKYFSNNEEIFIIGGAQIYKLFEDRALTIYESHIYGDYNCDTFYQPNFSNFKLIKEEEFNNHTFKIWKK